MSRQRHLTGNEPEPPPCRLSVILAREAPRAVILRRGPSNWVQLILWHTDTDRFENGQWFKGRIYENESDLSPDGSMFLYAASKFSARTLADTEVGYAWIAISKPPYLTAFVLWPASGQRRRGGLFESSSLIWLDDPYGDSLREPKTLPGGVHLTRALKTIGPLNGAGRRRAREGWQVVQNGIFDRKSPNGRREDASQPMIERRPHPSEPLVLVRTITALRWRRIGGIYEDVYAVARSSGDTLLTLPPLPLARRHIARPHVCLDGGTLRRQYRNCTCGVLLPRDHTEPPSLLQHMAVCNYLPAPM